MRIRIRALLLGGIGLLGAGFAVARPSPAADPAIMAPRLAVMDAPAAELIDTQIVQSGETLSEVFGRFGLTADLPELLLAVREQLDPRRVRANTPVVVHRTADDHGLRAVDVRVNADSTVRLEPGPTGWTGRMLLTPVEVDTVTVAGVLGEGGSIYSALVNHPGLDLPLQVREGMVWDLAHIYGWEIDFAHDMRPGDAFRVVFEREARPDGTSRASRVLVAEIRSHDRQLEAIHFDPRGDGGDYYRPDGQSLRLAFLRYPVDFPRITSNFSWNRYHPVLQRSRPHLGTDFGAARGTPVKSTADGTVAYAAWEGGYGNLVRINHGNGYETRYGHLNRFAKGIRRGARVKQGQVIGYAGSTGLATGPHVHYEMRLAGRPTDPRKVRLPSAPAVSKQDMAEFEELVADRARLLAALPFPDEDGATLAAADTTPGAVSTD